MIMPNWIVKKVADWASKNVNPEGNYEDALEGRPKNVNLTSDAGFKKYLGLPYDDKLIIDNKDGTYRLPKDVENLITVDTTFVKNRMNTNKKLYNGLYKQNKNHKSLDMFDNAIKSDSIYLNKLRDLYNKGKSISVNEYEVWKDRKMVLDGETKYPVSPLNVLRNFTLSPNKEKNKIEYSDKYDLDKISFVDKIFTPFNIKGTIPNSKLNNK